MKIISNSFLLRTILKNSKKITLLKNPFSVLNYKWIKSKNKYNKVYKGRQASTFLAFSTIHLVNIQSFWKDTIKVKYRSMQAPKLKIKNKQSKIIPRNNNNLKAIFWKKIKPIKFWMINFSFNKTLRKNKDKKTCF